MATVVQNITVADEWYVGEDKVFTFTVRDVNGVVVNITGYTFEWTVRTGRSHPVKRITKTSGAGIVITDAVNGVLTVTVARADTLGPPIFRAGRYYHGLARTNSGVYDVEIDGYADLLKSAVN